MTKSRGVNRPKFVWTDELEARMRVEYPHVLTRDIAAAIGATEAQCHGKARRLGLKKSAAFLSGPMAQRLDGHRGHGKRFKKGHVPWTAGKKMPGYAVGRMAETQFKKGQLSGRNARNYIPIGGHRINAEGYLDRKVQDDGRPQDRFERVHRLVWREAHGEIPDGHCVVFKRGLKTTVLEEITVDRLECLTNAENLRRNQLPPELRSISLLRGALTRAINRKAEQAEHA